MKGITSYCNENEFEIFLLKSQDHEYEVIVVHGLRCCWHYNHIN